MLLMASNKEKYGRMGAVDREKIERELRAQWERENKAPFDDAIAMLDAQVLKQLRIISGNMDLYPQFKNAQPRHT